jgi:hypothetical protein
MSEKDEQTVDERVPEGGSMNGTSNQTGPESFALSLVRDDLIYRFQRRIGLIPAKGPGIVRRAVFWSLLAWLPIALWAWYTGRALSQEVNEPLLAHFGIHVRFLVAVPLLIFAEASAHGVGMRLLPYFAKSGVLPEAELPRFRAALTDIARLRNASFPWVTILAVVITVITVSDVMHQSHEIMWAVDGEGGSQHMGFGAWWFLYVGRTIYLALLLSWLWRVVLLFLLFGRIAKLNLSIVPTHPDRAGGLGFLERFPKAFLLVALAASAVLASRWAHDVVYHGVTVQSLRLPMIAFVIAVIVLFLSPLFMFIGPLFRAKRQALLDYGALVGHHGRLVRERWIEEKEVQDDAILNAPELGPVADTTSLYEAVKRMRIVPLGKSSVMPLVLAAGLPVIVVLAIQVPVKQILQMLLKTLL